VLLFSNLTNTTPINPSEIRRLSPPSTVDVFVADSGTNGLALDLDGTVLGCSHKVQGIIRVNPTSGAMTTLLDTDSNGKHFNSPNDLTVRSDGTIYFTDPDYQLGSSRTSETGIKGVYRVTPSRQVILVDGTFGEPNGVALSPDETVLYVSDFSANAIRRFTVAADGSTSGRQNFATVTSPDGVAVDCAGNLYWASNTSAGAVRVFSPSGTQLGTISVPSGVSNVAFGGSDRKTLYITAGRGLYSLALNVPGFPY
jgi:gluconolactonase